MFTASPNASGGGFGVGSSTPGPFSSTFVLVWFAEHVVYGGGLYFLEFDELQIEEEMNGHFTGGEDGGGVTLMHTHPEPDTEA